MLRPLITLLLLLAAVPVQAETVFSYNSRELQVSLTDIEEKNQSVLTIQSLSNSTLQHFELNSPRRLVIDILHASTEKSIKKELKTHPLFNAVRMGSHPDKTRVVLELKKFNTAEYTSSARTGHLTLTFSTTSANNDNNKTSGSVAEKKLLLPAHTETGFSLSGHYITFQPDNRRIRNITIHSRSNQMLELKTIVQQLHRPGSPDEKRTPTELLLVSPKHLKIAPYQERTIRLVLNSDNFNKEKTFRISIVPEAPALSKKNKTTGIQVLAGLGLLVTTRAEDALPEIKWRRTEDTITVWNDGESNTLLEEAKLCERKLRQCNMINSPRLYPGNIWSIKASDTAELSFITRDNILGDNLISIKPEQR